MKATTFIDDRWVKFIQNNKVCIGKTFTIETTNCNKPNEQFVYFITEDRKVKNINFNQCKDLKYLEFIPKHRQMKELEELNNDLTISTGIELFIRPIISKKTITTLAKSYSNKINCN